MAKSILNTVVTFGVIPISVRIYSAASENAVKFHTLHRECKSPLRQKRWCPVHDREVFQDEVMRAYEYSNGMYVEVTGEEVEAAQGEASHTIDIQDFVSLHEIDRAFVQSTYWLDPDPVAIRAFSLVRRVLQEEQVAALGIVVMRSTERLCLVRPTDRTLALETMYWPSEVRFDDAPVVPQVVVSDAELDLARMFIRSSRKPFEPASYRSKFRESLLAVIEAKQGKQDVLFAPGVKQKAAPAAPPQDLMAALRESVKQAQEHRATAAAVSEPAVLAESEPAPAGKARRRPSVKKAA